MTVVCAAVAGILMIGVNQAPPDTHQADIQALRDNEALWSRDYAAKDVDKIAAPRRR
jgi:hypothetical protein